MKARDALVAVLGNRRLVPLIGVCVFLVSATTAIALQTRVSLGDVDPSSANPGGEVPNYAANGGFGTLAGIAVDASGGDLYVLDTSGSASAGIEGTGAVHRFDNAGTRLNSFDGAGTAAGSLGVGSDSDVTVDSSGTASDGNVYVSDINSGRVLAFDASGALVASFDTDGELDGSATPAGSFSYPCGLAVDPANGNVLVADAFNNRIWIFDSTGAYKGRISDSAALQGPCGLAFDSANHLYVRNSFNGKVAAFNRASATEYEFERTAYDPANGTPEDSSDDLPGATDVAVDPGTGSLFVDTGSQIREYDSGGSPLSVVGALGESRAVAADGAATRVYATDGNVLRVFGAMIILPEITTGGASDIDGDSATVLGTIDPAGGPDAQCEVEYGTTESYGSSTPCLPTGPYSSPTNVSAELTSLQPGTEYHYRFRATNPDGEDTGKDRAFATDGPPIVSAFSVTGVDSTSATLDAQINPAGTPTKYRFEYVTDSQFQVTGFAGATRVPASDVEVGSGSTAKPVTRSIVGLEPETKYRYRVVASNAIGVTEAAPKWFKTPALAQAPKVGEFPGEGFLPNGRVWEMVSPSNKLGQQIGFDERRIGISGDGNRITYSSVGAFADAMWLGNTSDYMAERSGSSGWDSHAIFPVQETTNAGVIAQVLDPTYMEYSDDLSTGVFRAWSPLTDAPNVVNQVNFYTRRDLDTPGHGTYELTTNCPDAVCNEPLPYNLLVKPLFAAASPDFDQVLFEHTLKLAPDAPQNFSQKTYKTTDGGDPVYVGVIPSQPARECGGSGPACDPTPAPNSFASAATASRYSERAMTEDGSRVFFRSQAALSPAALYMRDDHGTVDPSDDTTAAIAGVAGATDRAVADDVQPATFWSASTGVDEDGNRVPARVFITTDEKLTDDDDNSTTDLYMWSEEADGDGKHLQRLSFDEEPVDGTTPNVEGLVGPMGASEDGEYVYFSNQGQLVADQPSLDTNGGAVGHGIFLWHAGELTYVGGNLVGGFASENFSAAVSSQGNGGTRMTPDGRHLLLTTKSPSLLTPHGKEDIDCLNFDCQQTYLYSADSNTMACVSCPASGAPLTERVFTDTSRGLSLHAGGKSLGRRISDDGRFSFFSTKMALVPGDTNGVLDAYQYDSQAGEPRLLSSGKSKMASFFLATDRDGSDAFILTAEPLSRWDVDQYYDVYDARIGGGVAEPTLSAGSCDGDACQPPPAQLNDPTPGSAALSGPGNVRSRGKALRCPKGSHKTKRKGKVRCAKRNKKRNADRNRRAGR